MYLSIQQAPYDNQKSIHQINFNRNLDGQGIQGQIQRLLARPDSVQREKVWVLDFLESRKMIYWNI